MYEKLPIAHVHSSYQNTIVLITDYKGECQAMLHTRRAIYHFATGDPMLRISDGGLYRRRACSVQRLPMLYCSSSVRVGMSKQIYMCSIRWTKISIQHVQVIFSTTSGK